MKIHGSTGGISRTVMFQMIMGAIEVALGSTQVIQPVLTPVQFALVFLGLSVAQKIINIYLRSITTTPLN